MRRENVGGSDKGFQVLNASQVEMSRNSMSGLRGEHRTKRRRRFSPVADRIEDVLREIRFFTKKNDFDRRGHRRSGGPAPSRFDDNRNGGPAVPPFEAFSSKDDVI
eukprot:scaffold421141_cov31-Attheya_sp.AAC.2